MLQAINGNGDAVRQLASTLHCDVNQIQSTLCSISNTVGLTGQQIINAVQSGDNAIASQIAACCCDTKNMITAQGYESRIATAEQTATLAGKIDAQTNLINDKFCALEMREMQKTIDQLRDERSALQTSLSQRAQNEYIATSLYPISTALTELRADFDCFKSHLPSTITLPYNQAVAVPNCVAAQYGFGPFGYGSNGSLWG